LRPDVPTLILAEERATQEIGPMASRNTPMAEVNRHGAVNDEKANRSDRPLLERLQRISAEIARQGDTTLKADKAFFDDLSGD
jgi:hypothetical protein